MKKIISIILSTIISVIALTSCANNATTTAETTEAPTPVKKEYTVYLTGFSDSIVGGRKDNLVLQSNLRPEAPPTSFTLQIDGKTYPGTHMSTHNYYQWKCDREAFLYEDNNIEVNYKINSFTEKLEYYSM